VKINLTGKFEVNQMSLAVG